MNNPENPMRINSAIDAPSFKLLSSKTPQADDRKMVDRKEQLKSKGASGTGSDHKD